MYFDKWNNKSGIIGAVTVNNERCVKVRDYGEKVYMRQNAWLWANGICVKERYCGEGG